MARDFISKKTRNEFREYFAGTTLAEIQSEFDAADIDRDAEFEPNVSGQRRSLVEQYYRTVDWQNAVDVKKMLVVFENVLGSLKELIEAGDRDLVGEHVARDAERSFKSLLRWLEKDGYEFRKGRLHPTGWQADLDDVSTAVVRLDVPELQRQIDRIRTAVENDPGLAIGTAKELVESTCKTILSDHNVEYDDNADLPKLVKETRAALGLVSESIPSSAKGAETIRRLLSNLGAVANGLAELRNMYGTGHGKHGKATGLSPRHARLAVGSAASLATFLLETHEDWTI